MESSKIRLAFGAFMVFVVSGYYSLDEARYLAWGRNAQADVVESYVSPNPGGRRRPDVRVVRVSFPDEEGRARTGTDLLHRDSEVRAGDRVAVDYIPGNEYMVRLVGHRNLAPVFIFLACLGAMAVFLGMLVREANEPAGRRRASPRRA